MEKVVVGPPLCAVAMAAGVWVAGPDAVATALLGFVCCLVGGVVALRTKGLVSVAMALVAWGGVGMFVAEQRSSSRRDGVLSDGASSPTTVCGVIDGPVDRFPEGARFRLQSDPGGTLLVVAWGRAVVRPGQYLCAKGDWTGAKRRSGLGLRDEADTLASAGANQFMWISAEDIETHESRSRLSLWAVAHRVQARFVSAVTGSVPPSAGRAVVLATF